MEINLNQFMTWDQITTYSIFVSLVFIFVNFTKELKYIKVIPTKYYSAGISFIMMIVVNIHNGTFRFWDLILYIFSSIIISASAGGIADFNKDKKFKSLNKS